MPEKPNVDNYYLAPTHRLTDLLRCLSGLGPSCVAASLTLCAQSGFSPAAIAREMHEFGEANFAPAADINSAIAPPQLAQNLTPLLPSALPDDGDLPSLTAQVGDPQQPPSLEPFPEPTPPQKLPPPSELLQPPTSPSVPPETLPEGAPATIRVERFEVEGSTVFDEEDFAEALAEFLNRPLSFAELFRARSAVTQLYTDNGYITTGAFIPPQELSDGIVTIRVVEGRIEDIQVAGTERLNPGYIRSRLALAAGPPLNINRLQEALQLLQLDPLIERLSSELSAGTRPGTNLLEVEVVEADTFQIGVNLNNNRSPSVGSFRRGVTLTQANFLGLGDALSSSYNNTDGSDNFNISYTVPINPRNGTLRFAYGVTSSQVIEEPFEILDIESTSRFYELTIRQPLHQTPAEEFALGLTFSRQESSSTLLDIPFPLSAGAEFSGRTRVSALRFFQEWTSRSERTVFAARSQVSFGVGIFGVTDNPSPPDSFFLSWRGQAQWVQLLDRDTLLLIRADAQLSDRPLLPLEQFGIGGQETVRGYRQDLLLADNAFLASAELRYPILRLANDGLVQIVPFFDIATAWNSADTDTLNPRTLSSLGVGLRWQQGDNLTMRLDWGIPLVDIDGSQNTWQESGLYFSINWNLF